MGSHRPSATIDHEVSTSRATVARLRCSVSTTSTSSTRMRRASPVPAERSTALVSVRGTSQGSESPNSHSRLAPVGSPAAPARRVSRCPVRELMCSATSRSADSPSRRMALGESRQVPSGARSR